MIAKFCYRCGREFTVIERFCPTCGCQRRIDIANNDWIDGDDIETTIKTHFFRGTEYKNIVAILCEYHNVSIDLRTLKR